MNPSTPPRQTVEPKPTHHFAEQPALVRPQTDVPGNAAESSPITLETVAEELNQRAANIRARNPGVSKVSQEETALRLTMVLIGEMKERKQPIRYATEQYARRVLHLIRWSGSNIAGGALIEYLIHHGGGEMDLYFHRLLDQTGYLEGNDLPQEMGTVIERMRRAGHDPLQSYNPGDNKRRLMCAVNEPDSMIWLVIVALQKEMEGEYPQLRNREMLIEKVTDRFVNALKTSNLSVTHARDWYRSHIASLMFHHTGPSLAGIIFCLLLIDLDDRTRELEGEVEKLKWAETALADAREELERCVRARNVEPEVDAARHRHASGRESVP